MHAVHRARLDNNNYNFTQGPLRLSADEGIHSARASSPTLWGGVYDPKSFLFFPYPALPPNVVRRPHIRGARTTDAIMVERKVDPRRGIFQRGGNCQRASVEMILHVAAAWGRLAGRLGASWRLLGHTGGQSWRPGGLVGASRGVWKASCGRLGAVAMRVGSEGPNPRQGWQIGALEGSRRE